MIMIKMRVVGVQTLVGVSKPVEMHIIVQERGANTISGREAVNRGGNRSGHLSRACGLAYFKPSLA